MKVFEAVAVGVLRHVIQPAVIISVALSLRVWIGPDLMPGEGSLWLGYALFHHLIGDAVANARDMIRARRKRMADRRRRERDARLAAEHQQRFDEWWDAASGRAEVAA